MVFATKKRGAALKLIGAAVVFASAVSQHFQYDRTQAASDRLSQAIDAQALIDKGALIEQTSMYVLHGNIDVPQRENLAAQHAQLVAIKYYQGLVAFVSTVDGVEGEEKQSDLAKVQRAANRVNDVVSLSDFMAMYNAVSAKYEPLLTQELTMLRAQRASSEFMYLTLYIMGGVILSFAGVMDWLLAEETKSASVVRGGGARGR